MKPFSLGFRWLVLRIAFRAHIFLDFKYKNHSTAGFANGDTSAVLAGVPAETTTATSTSAPGTYPINITQGTLDGSNLHICVRQWHFEN